MPVRNISERYSLQRNQELFGGEYACLFENDRLGMVIDGKALIRKPPVPGPPLRAAAVLLPKFFVNCGGVEREIGARIVAHGHAEQVRVVPHRHHWLKSE